MHTYYKYILIRCLVRQLSGFRPRTANLRWPPAPASEHKHMALCSEDSAAAELSETTACSDTCIYIYIYIERERDVCTYIYVYIYIYVYTHMCVYIYIMFPHFYILQRGCNVNVSTFNDKNNNKDDENGNDNDNGSNNSDSDKNEEIGNKTTTVCNHIEDRAKVKLRKQTPACHLASTFCKGGCSGNRVK